jgi:hypothetical protein
MPEGFLAHLKTSNHKPTNTAAKFVPYREYRFRAKNPSSAPKMLSLCSYILMTECQLSRSHLYGNLKLLDEKSRRSQMTSCVVAPVAPAPKMRKGPEIQAQILIRNGTDRSDATTPLRVKQAPLQRATIPT